jgi:O-antigen/teichoic acid export membrane protein
MFSSLSLLQKDDFKFNKMYSRVYNLVITTSFFLSSIAFITGEFLIKNIYGEKWIPSIVIFKILMIKGIVLPHNGIIVTAILSKGHAKQNFQFGNVKKLINILPLLILLYFKDLNIFLYAILFTQISIVFFNLFVSFKILKVSYFDQIKPLLMNFTFSLTLLLGLTMFVKFESNFIEVFIQTLLYIGFFALFTFLLNKEVIFELKQILERNKKKVS